MATLEEENVIPNYDIDYSDEHLTQWETKGEAAKAESDATYDGMIADTDQYYDKLIQSSKDWADKQAQIQQENTDFTIEKIEQEKAKANQDYIKEQSGAYVDWQKQSNKYGAEAEKIASAGLTNTGYSESSQVAMYNTYQNRLSSAREVYNQAVLNYNNAIKEAQLQNNAALAEIAYQALEKELELSLQGFQYKNQLILDKANKNLEIDNMYYQRWQDTLQQMNTENAMKVDIWKYQDNQKWQTEQAELDRQFQEKLNTINNDFKAKEAELDRKHDKEMLEAQTKKEKELLEIQHKNDMAKLAQQKANEIAILEKEYEISRRSVVNNNNDGSTQVIGAGNLIKTSGNSSVSNTSGSGNTNKTSYNYSPANYVAAKQILQMHLVPSKHQDELKSEVQWNALSSASWEKQTYKTYNAYLRSATNLLLENYSGLKK